MVFLHGWLGLLLTSLTLNYMVCGNTICRPISIFLPGRVCSVENCLAIYTWCYRKPNIHWYLIDDIITFIPIAGVWLLPRPILQRNNYYPIWWNSICWPFKTVLLVWQPQPKQVWNERTQMPPNYKQWLLYSLKLDHWVGCNGPHYCNDVTSLPSWR